MKFCKCMNDNDQVPNTHCVVCELPIKKYWDNSTGVWMPRKFKHSIHMLSIRVVDDDNVGVEVIRSRVYAALKAFNLDAEIL